MGEPEFDPNPYYVRARQLFVREPSNPIIEPRHIDLPCKAVCNPGAVEFEGDVLLLLRVINPDDLSCVLVARSKDGISDWRFEPSPLLAPAEWYDEDGCEDARITYLADREAYAITYVGYSRFGAGVCLALTKDFKTVERLGMIVHPYNKDAVLLPERIDGKYRLLHRPTIAPQEDIWISESEDLLHWGRPHCVIQESDRPGWRGGKIGAGPPPYRARDGWLLIYHGVERKDERWTYRTGLALLDPEAPEKALGIWPEWVFGPEKPYEVDDKGQGIVFPTGVILRGDTLMMYYGAGDRSVGLATANLDELQKLGDEFARAAEEKANA